MRLHDRLSELRALMAAQARAPGRTFRAQVRARRLPRSLRADAALLAQAEAMAAHPRLARIADAPAARAHGRLVRHLRALDPVAARRRRALDAVALGGFYVLVTAGAFVGWLAWRGG